jgi:uncharacterized protein YajQ (UPF0234 family)
MRYDIKLAEAQVRDLEDKAESLGSSQDRDDVERILNILHSMLERAEEKAELEFQEEYGEE